MQTLGLLALGVYGPPGLEALGQFASLSVALIILASGRKTDSVPATRSLELLEPLDAIFTWSHIVLGLLMLKACDPSDFSRHMWVRLWNRGCQ